MKLLQKFFLSLLATATAGFPTLIYLTASRLRVPENYWQQQGFGGVADIWVFYGIQGVLFGCLAIALILIWGK